MEKSAIKGGGGGGRLMAKVMKNFHIFLGGYFPLLKSFQLSPNNKASKRIFLGGWRETLFNMDE